HVRRRGHSGRANWRRAAGVSAVRPAVPAAPAARLRGVAGGDLRGGARGAGNGRGCTRGGRGRGRKQREGGIRGEGRERRGGGGAGGGVASDAPPVARHAVPGYGCGGAGGSTS